MKQKDFFQFFSFLTLFQPMHFTFKTRLSYNILFLDLIATYKGYRHCYGYPVRGQRTWSNATSCFSTNLLLRQIRLKLLRQMIRLNSKQPAIFYYFAEQLNLLWKIQWHSEWSQARKKQKLANIKQNTELLDTTSVLRKDVSGISRRSSIHKKKTYSKKKKAFVLGYNVGFTTL